MNLNVRRILAHSPILKKIRKKKYFKELENLIEQHKLKTQSTDSSQEILITSNNKEIEKLKTNNNLKESELKFTFNLPKENQIFSNKQNNKYHSTKNNNNNNSNIKLNKISSLKNQSRKDLVSFKEESIQPIIQNIPNININLDTNTKSNINFNTSNNSVNQIFYSPKFPNEITQNNNNNDKTAGFNFVNKSDKNYSNNNNNNTIKKDLNKDISENEKNSHLGFLNYMDKKKQENDLKKRRNSLKNILDAFTNVNGNINNEKIDNNNNVNNFNKFDSRSEIPQMKMNIIPEGKNECEIFNFDNNSSNNVNIRSRIKILLFFFKFFSFFLDKSY